MFKYIKTKFSEIDLSVRIFFLFSCVSLLVGALGIVLYGIFTSTYGPIWVRNQYIGLWLLSILFFYSIQSIYLELKTWSTKVGFIVDLTYSIISVIISLILSIFYFISVRIDGIIWGLYIVVINLINILVLFLKRKHLKNLTPNSRKNLPAYICTQAIRVLNFIFKILFIIIICFMINSAALEGIGLKKFPARGKIVDIKISSNSSKTVKFHFLCDGPKSNKPVFLFEGSVSHGLADYLSIQKLLKQNNRRSCIWDKPGSGYSDYLLTDIKSHADMYHYMITSLREEPPFDFVAWGGGSSYIYGYAYSHPEMIRSLTFIDGGQDVEFRLVKEIKNWTEAETENFKRSQLLSRKSIFRLINGIGVPFGLMSIFIPPYKSFFPEFFDEVNWYFLTEKTWITQEYLLETLLFQKDVFDIYKINKTIPINVIMTVKSDEQIKEQVCKKQNLPEERCKYEIAANQLLIEYKRNVTNFGSTGKIFNCTNDDCDLGYYVTTGANYTVNKLLEI